MSFETDATGEGRSVEIVDREVCYQGSFAWSGVRLRHSLHRGGMSPVLVRELLEKGDVVAVLPYDPITDTVVLIEQFRVGAIGPSAARGCWRSSPGLMEPGEAPAEVARREATEEAGLAVRRIEPIARFFATPSKSSELTHSRLRGGGCLPRRRCSRPRARGGGHPRDSHAAEQAFAPARDRPDRFGVADHRSDVAAFAPRAPARAWSGHGGIDPPAPAAGTS